MFRQVRRLIIGGAAQTLFQRVSLQLRVFGFGLLQDGDVGVGVGVFSEGEEILIGRLGLRGVTGLDVASSS